MEKEYNWAEFNELYAPFIKNSLPYIKGFSPLSITIRIPIGLDVKALFQDTPVASMFKSVSISNDMQIKPDSQYNQGYDEYELGHLRTVVLEYAFPMSNICYGEFWSAIR